MDQVGAIVDGADRHVGGQARLDFGDLLLEAIDHRQRIFAIPRHRDARDDFAFTVEFGDAATLVGN